MTASGRWLGTSTLLRGDSEVTPVPQPAFPYAVLVSMNPGESLSISNS